MNLKKKVVTRTKQIQFKGIPAAPGIAIAKAHIFGTEEIMPREIGLTEYETPTLKWFREHGLKGLRY